MRSLAFLSLFLSPQNASSTKSAIPPLTIDELKLSSFAMVMAHDAASGYLSTHFGIKNEIYDWTKTQTFPTLKNARDLLECGGRAFDWRPKLTKDNKLIAHHGDVNIDHDFKDSIAEFTSFLSDNPDEFAVLTVWDCETESGAASTCDAEVSSQLSDLKLIPVTSCDDLLHITVGEAKKLGQLETGGSLLVVTGAEGPGGASCSTGNYDSAIACWGETRRRATSNDTDTDTDTDADTDVEIFGAYSCWDSKDSKNTPLAQMDAYLDTVGGQSSFSTPFNEMQCIWQETTDSVVIGELHLSSLVEDEEKSKLNKRLTQFVKDGRFENLNLVMVNNVCDGGLALKAALDEFNANKLK